MHNVTWSIIWSSETVSWKDQDTDHMERYIRTLIHVLRLVLRDYYNHKIGYN